MSENHNELNRANFKLLIDGTTFKGLEYNCQTLSIPSISSPEAIAKYHGRTIYPAGESLEYDPLTITYKVDEDLLNFLALRKWLIDNTEYETMLDITVHLYSSKNNLNKVVRFHDAIPTVVGEIPLDVQVTSVEPIQASATFRYTEYEIN